MSFTANNHSYYRAMTLRFLRAWAKDDDGWTRKTISNPGYFNALNSLEGQGVIETRGIYDYDDDFDGYQLRLRTDFDGGPVTPLDL